MVLRYVLLSLFVALFLSPCYAPPKIDDDGSDSEEYTKPPPPVLYDEDGSDSDEYLPAPIPSPSPSPSFHDNAQNSGSAVIEISGEGTFQHHLSNDDGTPRLWERLKLPTIKRTAPPIFVIAEMDEHSKFFWKKREPDEDDQSFISADSQWLQKGIVMEYTDSDECVYDCNGEAGPGFMTLQRRLEEKLKARKNSYLYKDAHGKPYGLTNPHADYLGKLAWAEEIITQELDDEGNPTGCILIYPGKDKKFTPLRSLASQKTPVKGVLKRAVSEGDRSETVKNHRKVLKNLLDDKADLVSMIQQSCPNCVDEVRRPKLPAAVIASSNLYSCWTVASFLALLNEHERDEIVVGVLRTLNPYGMDEMLCFKEFVILDASLRYGAFDLNPALDHLPCPPGVDPTHFQRQRNIRTFFNQAIEKCTRAWGY